MQARKVEEVPAPVALTKDYLVKVGDFTSPETVLDEVAENALVLGSLIAETRDFDLYPDMIADHYVKMFEQLSIQIPVIAATLIAVQQDAPSFVGVILRKLETALLNSVQQDYVAVTKLLLRSLACLVSCRVVSVASFTNILKMLCQVIANGIDNMQLSEEGEVAAYLLAVSIPWVAETLASVQEGLYVLQDCHKMLKCALSTWKSPFCVGGTQAVLFRCSPIEEDSSPWLGLVQDSNGTSDTLEESIKVSCSLLEELFANAAGCKLPDCVIATWKVAEVSENIQFDSMNPNELQDSFLEEFRNLLESSALGRRFRDNVLHGSVSSSIGDARSAGKYTSWLHGRVPIFTADCSAEAEICAKLSYAEKSTIFGYYQDIMMFFDPIINDDGTKLGNIDMMIDHLWAVKSLFAEDHHIEFLLGEFLFNMLLQQPFNSAQHAQVSRIILQLCRKYGSAFTPVVGLATNLLWNMLPDLDMGSLRQFAEWFSFYWVNTKYCWPYWAHWENECNVANTTILDNASDEELIPAKYSILFCRQFLSKSSRIIANEKLVKVLPEFFHQYLPKQDTPAWYFTSRVQSKDCSTDVKSVVTQLQTMLLERKHGGDEVLKFLLEVPKLVEDVRIMYFTVPLWLLDLILFYAVCRITKDYCVKYS